MGSSSDAKKRASEEALLLSRIGGGSADPAIVEGLLGKGAGEHIQNFELIRRISEGGFAEVFEAEQKEPVQRRVALKLIKARRMSDAGIARFEAESQALAMMDHPNIAKMFEAGTTDDGQPFFAMEFVDGSSITEYCEREKLGVKERVRLLITVCEAVQHAHRKGVIHRDLKPPNVLVSEAGDDASPKIIDFGIARAVDRFGGEEVTALTAEHQVVGTLAYMSPEQLSAGGAEVDTRTDVYGLGALAYEVLAGSTPFGRDTETPSDYAKALEQIRGHEPVRPSRNEGRSLPEKALKGDLDWIVLRALEKEPSRRYESPGAMAADLRAYLENRPVEAGAPGKLYRLGKFLRRHRAPIAAAAAIAVALIAGAVASFIQAERARAAEQEAVANARATQEITDFLYEDILGRDGHGTREPMADWTFKQIAERAAERLENRRLDDLPEVKAELHWIIGRIYTIYGDFDGAEPHIDQALSIAEEVHGPRAEKTLTYLKSRAMLFADRAHFDKAIADLREVIARSRNLDAPNLKARSALMSLSIEIDDLEGAEEVCLGLIAEPDLPRRNFLDAKLGLGKIQRKRKQFAKAEETFHNVFAIAEAEDPTGWEAHRAKVELARVYNDSHDYSRAEPLCLEIIEESRAKYDRLPDIDIDVLTNLGTLCLNEIRFKEAESFLTEALNLARASFGGTHADTLSLYQLLAAAKENLGDVDAAEQLHEDALVGMHKELRPDHPRVLAAVFRLGAFYERHLAFSDSARMFLRYMREVPDEPRLAAAMENAVILDTRKVCYPEGIRAQTRWDYRTDEPDADWYQPGFLPDEDGWGPGIPPFGSIDVGRVMTDWLTPDIWMRTLAGFRRKPNTPIVIRAIHDDDIEFFINGVSALKRTGTSGGVYQFYEMSPEGYDALVAGDNYYAIHCKDTGGSGGIVDLGLYYDQDDTADAMIGAYERLLQYDPENKDWQEALGTWRADLARFARMGDTPLRSANPEKASQEDLAAEVHGRKFERSRRSQHLQISFNTEDKLVGANWREERELEIIPSAVEWYYRDAAERPDPDWNQKVDTTWENERAPFGYGESDIETELPHNDPDTRVLGCLFTRTFDVADPAALEKIKVRLRADDGAAVYINGAEVVRYNLAPDSPHDGLALRQIPSPEEARYRITLLDPTVLKIGENVIAVEAYQASPTSSDFYYDLVLEALEKE